MRPPSSIGSIGSTSPIGSTGSTGSTSPRDAQLPLGALSRSGDQHRRTAQVRDPTPHRLADPEPPLDRSRSEPVRRDTWPLVADGDHHTGAEVLDQH
ncbi:MAG: hypothetical protein ACR2HA_08715, partial [Nocardioides sp.]